MKKSYKIALYSITAVLVITIIVTFVMRHNLLPQNVQGNLWHQNTSTVSNQNQSDKTLHHLGDVVKTNGDIYSFTYKLTKVTSSKFRNIINFPMGEVWNGVTVDKDGNITNDYSYVVLQVTVTNPKNEEQELYLNSNILDFRNVSGNRNDDYGTELFAMNRNVENFEKKNSMQYIFKPKESVDFELVYIVKDEYMDSDSYTKVFTITNSTLLVKNPDTGLYEYSDEVRYIEIRQGDINKSEKITEN